MYRTFDIFNQLERPAIILCNPHKDQIYSLDMAYNVSLINRFNSMSEINLTIPQYLRGHGWDEVEAYEYISEKRLVYFENFGYYEIKRVSEQVSGDINIKVVLAQSLEVKMVGKRITGFGGTYKFYDPINVENTILGQVMEYIPNWSIGSVDATLWDKYRTFDVVDTNVYAFLMGDISQTYECVFEFDTINNEINVYSVDSATTDTSIYFSFDNLLKSGEVVDIDEEITTKLSVYGSGNLDIRSVNPIGTTSIYNFDHFKTTDWMSQGLIDAINDWETIYDSFLIGYGEQIAFIKSLYADITLYESELATLQSDYLGLEAVQKTRIENNLDFSDITPFIEAKQAEIDDKTLQILNANNQVDASLLIIQAVNDGVSFEANFTEAELLELDEFIFENTYQNENIIQTDIMTEDEKLEQAEELYAQGQDVLARLSVPRFTFSVESINFLSIPEYDSFVDQLEVGANVTIEFPNETTTEATVLEISINYDNPSDFNFVLSNRLRLDNNAFQFSDLFGQVQKTGSSIDFKKSEWQNWSTNYKDDVTTFINSALDTSVNNLINSSYQEIVINQNGLRGRTWDSVTETFGDEQVWLTSSVLAFTNDAWQTAKTALGKVTVGGTDYYGLVADVIVGRMLAGNQLTIENEGGNFVLDENGAVLTDASFTLTKSNNRNRITIDADVGIQIEQNSGGTWTRNFWVDSLGNVVFAGNLSGASGSFSGSITATSGSIGGWNISSDRIYDSLGNYIRSDGWIKLGALSIEGSKATFSGDIYANKISGTILNDQLTSSIDAGKIKSYFEVGGYGTLSGYSVYGGKIQGNGGVAFDMTATGAPILRANNSFDMRINSSNLVGVSNGYCGIWSSNATIIEASSEIRLNAPTLKINGIQGDTRTFRVGTGYFVKELNFVDGIFTGYTIIT